MTNNYFKFIFLKRTRIDSFEKESYDALL